MRKSYVKELKEEFNKSGTPKYVVDEKVKSDFEQRLGRTLPDDYYDFLNSFGHACFSDYMIVADPFIPNGIEYYFDEYDLMKNSYYDGKSIYDSNAKAVKDENGNLKVLSDSDNVFQNIDFGEIKQNDTVYGKLLCMGFGFPYDFYKNGSGLILWGDNDDCQFYWNFSDNSYTIVAYCDDEYYEYDMTFSEFLYHYLNDNIIGSAFDTDEPFTYEELELVQ